MDSELEPPQLGVGERSVSPLQNISHGCDTGCRLLPGDSLLAGVNGSGRGVFRERRGFHHGMVVCVSRRPHGFVVDRSARVVPCGVSADLSIIRTFFCFPPFGGGCGST